VDGLDDVLSYELAALPGLLPDRQIVIPPLFDPASKRWYRTGGVDQSGLGFGFQELESAADADPVGMQQDCQQHLAFQFGDLALPFLIAVAMQESIHILLALFIAFQPEA